MTSNHLIIAGIGLIVLVGNISPKQGELFFTNASTTPIIAAQSNKIKAPNPEQYEGKAIPHSMAGLPDSGTLDCVALLNVDFFNRTGLKPLIKAGSALQIWQNPSLFFPEGFTDYDVIPNTPDFVPQVGDYVFWDSYPESSNPEFKTKAWDGRTLSGKSEYGHVAIAMASTDKVLTVKNQDTFSNNGKGDKPTWQSDYVYNGVVGVFRLRDKSMPLPAKPVKVTLQAQAPDKPKTCQATAKSKYKDGASLESINEALRFYTSEGMSCTGAIYFVANLIQESQLDPLVHEWCPINLWCGQSRGLLQWRATRLDDLRQMCNPEGDFTCQLKFTIKELKGNNGVSTNEWRFLTGEYDNDITSIKSAIQKVIRWGDLGDRWKIATELTNQIL